jgi:hypothetical protein
MQQTLNDSAKAAVSLELRLEVTARHPPAERPVRRSDSCHLRRRCLPHQSPGHLVSALPDEGYRRSPKEQMATVAVAASVADRRGWRVVAQRRRPEEDQLGQGHACCLLHERAGPCQSR